MADLYNNTDLLRQAIDNLADKIAGDISGSGTSGAIAVFNGEKSIKAGPSFNSANTTSFLREDGEWAPITTTDTKYTLDCDPDQQDGSIFFGIKEQGSSSSGSTVEIGGENGIEVYTDEMGSIIISGSGANITGAASTIATTNLTASRALISNSSGKVGVSAVTSTELEYLDGVTSNVQAQINALINRVAALEAALGCNL